jgi:formylglycine-generating enzyme required for sulfatase activity
MANAWQGRFRWQNLLLDRYERTSPVKSFPPNGYGLCDMAGSVWEWTSDFFTPPDPDGISHPCCAAQNPRMASPEPSYDPHAPGETFPSNDQGRLPPLRPELLSALPPGRLARPAGGHDHHPP